MPAKNPTHRHFFQSTLFSKTATPTVFFECSAGIGYLTDYWSLFKKVHVGQAKNYFFL